METLPHNFRRLTWAAFLALFLKLGLAAQSQTNLAGFKTNGDTVTAGGVSFKKNSPLNSEESKQYRIRVDQLFKIGSSGASNATDKLVEGSWTLIKDYPARPNGYQCLMMAIEDYEFIGQPAKARATAEDLAASSAPVRFKLWAKGCLNRFDSSGKPVSIKFSAVDGRAVDLASLRGKVVLVDFWATTCGPCVAELPEVKAAYDKFHARGFEIIGVSCDTDMARLKTFLDEHKYPWPQYFDGEQQESNKFAQGFGIDGIPHMFLIDKKGLLHFDRVRARNPAEFESRISSLLAEPPGD